jgi:hypothetical protein
MDDGKSGYDGGHRLCIIAVEQPIMKHTHLIHPVTGDRILFDVRGEAVCPMCRARWRRVMNVVKLAE